RLMIVTAALLLSSVTVAFAQADKATTTAPATPAATAAAPSLGTLDLGFRGTSTSGDAARYQRYQDLRNGANINFDFAKTTATQAWAFTGSNVGYDDQRLTAEFANSKFTVSGFFDGVPTNYGMDGMTKTPWVESSKGVWTLDTAARQQVENKTAVGVLCAPGLAATATCTGLTAPTVLTYPSIFRGLARDFDISTQRNTIGFGLTYGVAPDVDLDVAFKSTSKSGNQPFGMGFAFNEAYELPISLDNRTNDFTVGMQWGSNNGMIRLAYDRSQFKQHIASVTFDNAVRRTDYNDGQPVDMTGNGPWDPSGYSNGNTAAVGRFAMPPSNTLDVYSATAMSKLPAHSSVNASVAFSTTKQNDALIAWTINPVIANAATYAYYPGLASLPRSSAQAQMDGLNAVLNFNSRPAPWVALTMRYRYADRTDRMPEFISDSTVRFDSVPEQGIVAPALYEGESHSSERQTFSAEATFNPIPFTALRLGFVDDDYAHTSRAFNSISDRTIKASFDTMGNQYVSFRAMVERSRRTGAGFEEEAITGAGGQEQSRMFDDADRTRDRRTLLVTISPTQMIDITGSYAFGEDQYDEPEHYFGLLNNKNTSGTVGVTVTPSQTIAFGVNAGQDKFNSFQRSRTANPYSGVPGAYESWTDPNRDWTVTNDEKVTNVDAFFDVTMKKTDLKFAYIYSDSDNAFIHGGPRIVALQNNSILTPGDTKPCTTGLTSCYEALPNVTSTWSRFTADLRQDFSARIGLGLTYWYEKLDVSDYATINLPGTDTPRIDYLGTLTTGYGVRPYKGNTFFARVFVKF
ncbi:MAG: MtrB/PioB family outer membrane beta-barrel protein, partial [Acidobacteria bacterium]|nr:MtrB/PioB family outer membrane beta-barrel protein [Acidobacteriota bacterium]